MAALSGKKYQNSVKNIDAEKLITDSETEFEGTTTSSEKESQSLSTIDLVLILVIFSLIFGAQKFYNNYV